MISGGRVFLIIFLLFAATHFMSCDSCSSSENCEFTSADSGLIVLTVGSYYVSNLSAQYVSPSNSIFDFCPSASGTTFTFISGSLPPGIQLLDGRISGTPTTAGTYAFTILASDTLSWSCTTTNADGTQTTTDYSRDVSFLKDYTIQVK